jgi:membrane protein DedA with SNARE-associated domain
MDALVSQLVQFVHGVPADSFFVVYLIVVVWLAIESLGIGVPEESILLLLGATVSLRQIDPVQGLTLAIGAAALGTILGALGGYSIGRRAGPAIVRVGRFVGLSQPRADRMELWLRQRGAVGVFAARLVPMMRGLSPYVIGASQERLSSFLLGTIAGALTFTGPWVVLGFALGAHYTDALGFLDRFGLLGLAGVVALVGVVWSLHYLWMRFVWGHLAAHFDRHRSVMPAAQSLHAGVRTQA